MQRLDPNLVKTLCENSTAHRYKTVTMSRYNVTTPSGMSIVFVGDAAHAMTPFLGKAANIAMRDSEALALLLDKHRGNIRAASGEYSVKRSPLGHLAGRESQRMYDRWRSNALLDQILTLYQVTTFASLLLFLH